MKKPTKRGPGRPAVPPSRPITLRVPADLEARIMRGAGVGTLQQVILATLAASVRR